MAEAVLFDFGGTLDADGLPWCDRFYAGYRSAGGKLALVTFEQYFAASDRLLASRPEVSTFGFRQMVETQVETLSGLLPDGQGLDRAAWGAGFIGETQTTVTRNRPLLERLAQRYELGVISNFTGNLRPCLEELGVAEHFVVVFDSGVVGIRKPDARLFRAAFDALGRHPEECWMVGDNPFADIEPATRLGCSTCWLAPAARTLPAGVAPTRRISALSQLPAALA